MIAVHILEGMELKYIETKILFDITYHHLLLPHDRGKALYHDQLQGTTCPADSNSPWCCVNIMKVVEAWSHEVSELQLIQWYIWNQRQMLTNELHWSLTKCWVNENEHAFHSPRIGLLIWDDNRGVSYRASTIWMLKMNVIVGTFRLLKWRKTWTV